VEEDTMSSRLAPMLASLLAAGSLSAAAQTSPAAPARPTPAAPVLRTGPAAELAPFAALVGRFNVALEQYRPKRKEWVPCPVVRSEISREFDGRYLRWRIDVTPPPGEHGEPFRVDFLFSWDVWLKTYRIVALDDVVGLLDVYDGRFVDGVL